MRLHVVRRSLRRDALRRQDGNVEKDSPGQIAGGDGGHLYILVLESKVSGPGLAPLPRYDAPRQQRRQVAAGDIQGDVEEDLVQARAAGGQHGETGAAIRPILVPLQGGERKQKLIYGGIPQKLQHKPGWLELRREGPPVLRPPPALVLPSFLRAHTGFSGARGAGDLSLFGVGN